MIAPRPPPERLSLHSPPPHSDRATGSQAPLIAACARAPNQRPQTRAPRPLPARDASPRCSLWPALPNPRATAAEQSTMLHRACACPGAVSTIGPLPAARAGRRWSPHSARTREQRERQRGSARLPVNLAPRRAAPPLLTRPLSTSLPTLVLNAHRMWPTRVPRRRCTAVSSMARSERGRFGGRKKELPPARPPRAPHDSRAPAPDPRLPGSRRARPPRRAHPPQSLPPPSHPPPPPPPQSITNQNRRPQRRAPLPPPPRSRAAAAATCPASPAPSPPTRPPPPPPSRPPRSPRP
jgi:hypothetical protein